MLSRLLQVRVSAVGLLHGVVRHGPAVVRLGLLLAAELLPQLAGDLKLGRALVELERLAALGDGGPGAGGCALLEAGLGRVEVQRVAQIDESQLEGAVVRGQDRIHVEVFDALLVWRDCSLILRGTRKDIHFL
jgi:hypothetical protein